MEKNPAVDVALLREKLHKAKMVRGEEGSLGHATPDFLSEDEIEQELQRKTHEYTFMAVSDLKARAIELRIPAEEIDAIAVSAASGRSKASTRDQKKKIIVRLLQQDRENLQATLPVSPESQGSDGPQMGEAVKQALAEKEVRYKKMLASSLKARASALGIPEADVERILSVGRDASKQDKANAKAALVRLLLKYDRIELLGNDSPPLTELPSPNSTVININATGFSLDDDEDEPTVQELQVKQEEYWSLRQDAEAEANNLASIQDQNERLQAELQALEELAGYASGAESVVPVV